MSVEGFLFFVDLDQCLKSSISCDFELLSCKIKDLSKLSYSSFFVSAPILQTLFVCDLRSYLGPLVEVLLQKNVHGLHNLVLLQRLKYFRKCFAEATEIRIGN